MKDFAGSTITYYDLARKKVLTKYPWLISVLVVLVLISMTGLALYLVSDLVSFATNPEHNGLLAELDLKASGNVSNGTDDTNNISKAKDAGAINNRTKGNATLASENLTGIMQKNITDTSTAAAGKSSITNVKSSSSSSKKHHSSSSSSSKSSSSKSSSNASISAASMQANQSINQSTAVLGNFTSQGNLSAQISSGANATMNLTQNSSIDEIKGQTGSAVPARTIALSSLSLSSLAQAGFNNPTSSVPSKEPEKMIQFKTLTGSEVSPAAKSTAESKSDQKATSSTAKTDTTKKTTESSKKTVAASSSKTNEAQQTKSKQTDQKNDKITALRERAAQLRARAK